MESASVPKSGTLLGAYIQGGKPDGKEAEHGVYPIVSEIAIRVPMRLHPAELSSFCLSHDGVGFIPSASLRHGTDLVQRLHATRTPQSLSPLLQPGTLVRGHALWGFGEVAGGDVRPHGDYRVGGGRHALPQTRLDGLWNRHAPRSADLQPRQAADELGSRLGRAHADRPLPLLGFYQGLEFANRLSLVSQSPGRDQGKEERKETETAEARPQPPHAAGTGGRTAFAGGKLVSRAKADRQRRQCLRRSERAREAAGQRGVDQPRASKRRLVRTRPSPFAAQKGSACEERATTARHGGLGRQSPATLEESGLRPVWSARHVAGQNDPRAVLHGGQGPAVDDRPGTRRAGQTPRSDVLLHLLGLGRAKDSLDVRGKVVDRSDLRELQAIAGAGRPGQSQRKGRAAHGADGAGALQPDCGLVSPNGPSPSPLSRSALVPQEARTVVCRHAHHAAAPQLAGQISHTAFAEQTREKTACPDHRVSQPCGLTRRLARQLTSTATHTSHKTATKPA